MQHITIQTIFAKYPTLYNILVERGRNNYRNLFFIDPSTAEEEIPTIYIMMQGRLYTNYFRNGNMLLRHVSFKKEQQVWAEALAEGHKAVEDKHPYLAHIIEETEAIWGISNSPSKSLF